MRSATIGDPRPGSRARHAAPEPALAVEAAVAQRASEAVPAQAAAMGRAEAVEAAGGVGAAEEAGGGAPTTLRRRLASADQGEPMQ